ncbi:MAG: hypothetical protein KDB63_12380 [Nocardioidaceae bacterium]|nr:hypothetical protein [Nocardioidaceae bacterium]
MAVGAAALLAGALALFVLWGGPSSGSADCGTLLSSDGVVFSERGTTERHAEPFGTALRSVCEDVGRNARGAVFTDDSRTLTTYRFAGYPASEVLGVRYRDDGPFIVFIADSVTAHDRDQIARELRR